MCDFPSHFVLEERFLDMGWDGGVRLTVAMRRRYPCRGG